MARFRPRLTFANVASALALFIALGSGAYAASQLPANSVGTAQLKKSAVTSPKIKDGTITGADVNEARLGRVPAAANATNAANAAKLGGLDPNSYLKAGTKVADAAHADSADDATTLGGKQPSDFVGVNDQAGGDLTGKFSALAVKEDAVSEVEIKGLQVRSVTLTDPDTGSSEVKTNLDTPGIFTISAHCNLGASNSVTGSINVTAASTNWSVNSSAAGGTADFTHLGLLDTLKLASFGPTSVQHLTSGAFALTDGTSTDALIGEVGLEINRSTGRCDFLYSRFGGANG